MEIHTKVFLKSRGLWPKAGVLSEPPVLLCEWCFHRNLSDVHHIEPKGMGGRSKPDSEDNLIGLCIPCHDSAHFLSAPYLKREELHNRVKLILSTIRTTGLEQEPPQG